MKRVYRCLSKNWSLDAGTDISKIESALRDSKAFEFMILWSVLETKLFNTFCRNKSTLWDYSRKNPLASEDIDDIIAYFHNRYKIHNGTKNEDYKHLIHQEDPTDINCILSKDYSGLDNRERIYLILYTIYRYRNNIFHGNKGVDAWGMYSDQIEKCVDAMIFFIDKHQIKNNDGCDKS